MSDLRIDRPCHEDWTAMTPTERGRFCASCRKEVLDLTTGSAAEGRQRIRHVVERVRSDPSVHVCVRGESDGRGRILTPAHRRLLTNAFAGMLAMAVAGCQGAGPKVGAAATPQQHEQQLGTGGETSSEPRTAEPSREPGTIGKLIEVQGDTIAPPLGEPALQAAGGVRAMPPEPKPADPSMPQANN